MRAASAAQAVGDVAAYNYFTAALPRGGTSRKVLKAAAQRARPAKQPRSRHGPGCSARRWTREMTSRR